MDIHYPESELILNADDSVFHLHLQPEQLADNVILVGDPDRVNLVASHLDTQESETRNREFHTITGTRGCKRITVVSTGIGCDNIDIVMNELDALANIDLHTRTDRPAHRHMWRTATVHAHRYIHLLGHLYRTGRTAEFLSFGFRHTRQRAGTSISHTHGVARTDLYRLSLRRTC